MCSLIKDMTDTLNVKMGVGLAACQIGTNKRVVILNCESLDFKNPDPSVPDSRMWVLINPEIELRGDDITWREACLSVPFFGGDVVRKSEVSLSYQDVTGNTKSCNTTWPMSGCLQHECDHLDGILFIDRMSRRAAAEIRRKIARRRQKNIKAVKKLRRRLRPEKVPLDTRMSHGPGKRKKKKK